jgi:Domain of unknown function (DUF4375)
LLELIILVVAALTFLTVWAGWRRIRRLPRAMKQFARDLLANPEYYEQIDEEHEKLIHAQDEAELAPPPSPAEFPTLIDDLLSHDSRRVRVAKIRLEKVAAEAEPILLAALDHPSATWTTDDTLWFDSSPAGRVVSLLAKIPSRVLGQRIGHLASHPNWQVHGVAIKARVALGRADDLPFVLSRLAEQCKYAQEGVELAIEKGWAEPEFIVGVREWAEQTTQDESRPFSYWAVGFYAEHGGLSAIEFLQSPRVLSVQNNRTVQAALEQLNCRGVRIEAVVVRPLLDKSLALPKTWPWNCVFRLALRALAMSDLEEATRLAEGQIDSPEKPYLSDATDFLREIGGLPQPWEIEPPDGLELTEDERGLLNDLAYCSVVFGQVRNGGLSQYFFNSYGDQWPRDVRALRTIGFEQGAAAVEQASRLIHPTGASIERNERIAQYARLSERAEKRLDELSRLFYTDVPILRFMQRHKALFTRVRQARLEAGLDKTGE